MTRFKRWCAAYSGAAALVMVMALIAPPSLAQPAADTLLSKGKPATASSTESSAYAAGDAVDGKTTTRWASKEGADPQWLSVDLGATAQISQVVLSWEAAYAKSYEIQVSADNTTWNTVYSTKNGKGGTETATTTGATGRYVRFYGTARGTSYGYSLWEFQVSGHLTTGTTPAAPANLRTTAVTDTAVSLAWDAAAAGSGGAVTKYNVFQHGSQIGTVDGKTLSYQATGLTPNTQYYFTIFAEDGAGGISPPSAELPVKTAASSDTEPPTAPADPHTTAVTANTVSLAWSASTDNVGVVGYDVYNGTTKAGTFAGTSGTIDGLAPATAYTFTVRAKDAAGNASDPSKAVTAKTAGGNGGGGTNPGEVTQITTDSDVPWGLAFLPDGSALVSERDTFRLVRITPAGKQTVVGKVPGVDTTGGEGGLLGLAVSKDFATDHWLYVFHTSSSDNRIVRFQYVNDKISGEQVLLTGIARNRYHNGGRLAFGPDGKLYATTGDAQNGDNAQNLNSLNGKILRLNPDGSVPADNPQSGKYFWSYGHRNVQGLAWDSKGRLWESELGDSKQDEVNLIVKGGNYGWPACEGTSGSCDNPGFIAPKRTFSPTAKHSPSGLAIVGDVLFMSELTGQEVQRMPISGDSLPSAKTYFTGAYGRLRTIVAAPDGSLWLTTTNGDKSGTPGKLDNKILRIALTGG
ncbi:PQQ-dependent sugar dehydrogenase [Amycolatopsis sp. NBC_01480]|uniref:PQQ-dependent sugar dehydrogenase n=1 Tax=Amycolatopsis sp. NBC_01480 TaxID=2903562 RepID=UPI002E29C0C5|nr:PQQ-dependent sugar dehydrogenase [Amycolatopsis sp. NBC_01480]